MVWKHWQSEYKCKLNGKERNSDQLWNNDKCQCEYKKYHVFEKNPPTCSCKNRKSLASVMDDSAIICDEVIDGDADTQAKLQDEAKSNGKEIKIVRANFNEKNITYKTQICLFFLAFY